MAEGGDENSRGSWSGVEVSVRISTPVVMGGFTLAAFFMLNDEQRKNVTDAVCTAIVSLGRRLIRITQGSLIVEVQCTTKESALKFLEEYVSGVMSQRIREEFEKIGFKELTTELIKYNEIKSQLQSVSFVGMAEASDAAEAMSEAVGNVAQAVRDAAQSAARASVRAGLSCELFRGKFEFVVEANNVTGETVEETIKWAGITTITLGGIYGGFKMGKRLLDIAISNACGGKRDDQEEPKTSAGNFLRVVLICLTGERFLEVLEMCKSGIMKECFENEFQKIRIDAKGLKITIKNMKEVNLRKELALEGRRTEKKSGEDKEHNIDARLSKQDFYKKSQLKEGDDQQLGYKHERFKETVRDVFHCPICTLVVKSPNMCENEHLFCSSCVLRHLQDSPTCPVCRASLAPESLKQLSRHLKNELAELEVKCKYNNRGCDDYLKVENLPRHEEECEFSPVTCGNEGCQEEINRRDKENHEKNLCDFRIARGYEIENIKTTQNDSKVVFFWIFVTFTFFFILLLLINQDKSVARQNKIAAIQDKLKASRDELKANQNKIKQNLDKVKQTQTAMKEDQAAMKVEMKQQFETLTNTMKDFQLEIIQSISRVSVRLPVKHEIIIAGGYFGLALKSTSNTVEKFSWPDGRWTYLSSMNQPRAAPSFGVYNNDVIVTGGYDGQGCLDTIEILKSNEKPLQWTLFNGKLPAKLACHAVIVYQDKLIIIGGCKENENKPSKVIYEMFLTPPYTTKMLVRMPEERRNHAVELVNNKLFILGGTTTEHAEGATDSVFVCDLTEKKCEPWATLPYAVCRIATVTWGNYIIVLGGENKKGETFNAVIKFDTVTGKSEKLPSMIYRRSSCSAVIIDDVIVVMGGWNEHQGTLGSVESLRIGSDAWKELPRMRERRRFATAVIKPQN